MYVIYWDYEYHPIGIPVAHVRDVPFFLTKKTLHSHRPQCRGTEFFAKRHR